MKKIIFVAAILTSLIHLVNVSGIVSFSAMTIRTFHLMMMLFICFWSFLERSQQWSKLNRFIRSLEAVLALISGVYILVRWESITSSGGVTTKLDILVGILAIFLVLEATRRATGFALAIISGLFLVYPFIAPYLPSILKGKGYTLSRVTAFLFTSTEGLFGIPIGVSSTYIILFCIYGALWFG